MFWDIQVFEKGTEKEYAIVKKIELFEENDLDKRVEIQLFLLFTLQ